MLCGLFQLTVSEWKDILSITKDIILTLVPIITVVIAIHSINKWKNEFRAKTNFEVSYKLLKSIYKLRDCLASARSPFIMANEMLPDNSIPDYEKQNKYHYHNKRASYIQEAYANFNSILPEVEALFDKELKDACGNINKVIFNYHISLNEYLQTYNDRRSDLGRFKELSNIVFIQTTPDEFGEQMNAAVIKIEAELSKHIKLK